MKSTLLLSVIAISLTACNTMPTAGEMAGATTGAIIGAQFGNGNGRLVTTAVGTVAGGMIGRELSQPKQVVIEPQKVYHVEHLRTYRNYDPYEVGEDHCIRIRQSKGENFGVAAAYCDGERRRKADEQIKLERDAYRRGYTGK